MDGAKTGKNYSLHLTHLLLLYTHHFSVVLLEEAVRDFPEFTTLIEFFPLLSKPEVDDALSSVLSQNQGGTGLPQSKGVSKLPIYPLVFNK